LWRASRCRRRCRRRCFRHCLRCFRRRRFHRRRRRRRRSWRRRRCYHLVVVVVAIAAATAIISTIVPSSSSQEGGGGTMQGQVVFSLLVPQSSILDVLHLTDNLNLESFFVYLRICGLRGNKNPTKYANTQKTPS